MNKENYYPTPLAPHTNNTPHNLNYHHKPREDKLVLAVEQEIATNKDCDLLSIILDDPHLKQLNFSLELQAQQKKKSKLLQNFPKRYNHLIQTEILYKKLEIEFQKQKDLKQGIMQQHAEQIESLNHQIKIQQECNISKDQQIKKLVFLQKVQLQSLQKQRRQQLQNKSKQIQAKDSVINELQSKYGKLKTEKQHITQFMGELKQENEILRAENDRIILNLTQKQLQIQQLHQTIAYNKNSYSQQVQEYMKRIDTIQNEFHIRFAYKNQQYHQLQVIVQQFKAKLKQCQVILEEQEKEKFQIQLLLNDKNLELQGKISDILSENQTLKLNIQNLEKEFSTKQANFNFIINSLSYQKQVREITIKQLTLNHELQLYQLKEHYLQSQANKNQTICQMEKKVLNLRQELVQFEIKKCQLMAQTETHLKSQEQASLQIQKLQKMNKQGSYREAKYEKKQKDIERMIEQFKKQLEKFNEIINQKEDKIQSYRKEILSLRKQVKEKTIQHRKIAIQADFDKEENLRNISQKQELWTQIQKLKQKCLILQQEIAITSQSTNKQTKNVQSQVQLQADNHENDSIQIGILQKELQKTKLKYQNVIEELTASKRQFRQQLLEREKLIQQLQKDSLNLQKTIDGRMHDNKEIQTLLDSKIRELKQFYENKMEQQSKRYRGTISTLKSQMAELYKDIDLKKSMQQEMFEEIMKINKDRNSRISE